ncbi:MAG: hypothetical protein ACTSR2_03035 [Candidatus Hodarchaeales archaeon]
MTLKNISFKPEKVLAYIVLFIILSSPNAPIFDVSSVDAKTINRKISQTPTMDIYTSIYQKITVDCINLLTNEKYNLTVRDRTADSTILSANITTDSVGSFSYVIDQSSYSEFQDQREIAVNATAYSNSSSSVEEYFTPILATDYLYYYEIGNEWDFSEGTTDNLRGGVGDIETIENGYYQLEDSSGSIVYVYENTVTGTYTVTFRIYSNVSLSNCYIKSYPSNALLTDVFSISSGWQEKEFDSITFSEGFYIYLKLSDKSLTKLDHIRLIHRDTPVITKAVDYCYASSENNTFKYRVYSEDNVLRGEYLDQEDVPLLTGNHTYTFIPYRDTARASVFLPATNVTFNYLRETENITTIWTPFGKAEDIAKGLYNHLPQIAVMSIFAIVVILFIKKNRRR